MSNIVILNGPNLNLTGVRLVDVYGPTSMADIIGRCVERGHELGHEITHVQSNHEGHLIDHVHQLRDTIAGAIVNPGALSASGYGLAEALEAVEVPFVEVHLSNIHRRGGWHAASIFAPYALGQISGFHGDSYVLALEALASYLAQASFPSHARSVLKTTRKGCVMNSQKAARSKTKPFHPWPFFDDQERRSLNEVLESGHWWRMTGDKVETFEREFAATCGTAYALGVTNGTHALELALAAMGIKAGDEVIVPAITFISTVTAVLYAGATPVLADVNPDTLCLAPDSLEAAITPRTRLVIPVHMAGQCCDMDEIGRIAREHDLKVLEDAAHAHGAEWRGERGGGLGDAAIFSFQNGKIMTSGEGGAFVTDNAQLFERAYHIHGAGRPRGDRTYQHVVLGSNYRMNEFQGALLLAQLSRLQRFNDIRHANAHSLDRRLSEIPGIRPLECDDRANRQTHYMYMFYLDSAKFGGMSRAEFIDALIEEGIPAFPCFPVLSDTEFFRNGRFESRIPDGAFQETVGLEHARAAASAVVWLPHFTLLGDEQDLDEIAVAISKVQQDARDRAR